MSANLPPLAERVRPQSLSDFTGQSLIIGSGSLLENAISQNSLFSMILWGPPGSGKTTLAKIISRTGNYSYFELSAVSSGVKDLRKVLKSGKENTIQPTLLFIDEIHRFSKSQQDALLHGVENGDITLIGATTENPSFEVISPLLSRCKVLKLSSHGEADLEIILQNAIDKDIKLSQRHIDLSNESRKLLIRSAGGDARKMLNTFEAAVSFMNEDSQKLTQEKIISALQVKTNIYDKSGDYHYDTISAFIKSIRGSDPDAAIYWLAVMLEGGEKPEFIARRLIILASEDIGNAEPYALTLANAAFDSVHKIGMPEAGLVLSQTTTYLASSPKSNAATIAIAEAKKFIRQNGSGSVPLHLRNAPTKMMKEMDYGKNYKYPHSFEDGFVKEHYFPEELKKPPSFYKPKSSGREKFIKDRLTQLWGNRFNK